MSSIGDATPSQGERVYTFISDPGHKETLSGRVRAACLTCRRKKIKCSGDEPCQTCRERGLACEGLPARKRSRRQSLYPWTNDDAIPTPSTSKLQSDNTSKAPSNIRTHRLSIPALQRPNEGGRHDSSYYSAISTKSRSVSPEDSPTTGYDRSIGSSPVLGHDLSRVASLNGASRGYRKTMHMPTSPIHTDSRTSSAHNIAPRSATQSDGRDTSELLIAAQMLERHASSLRELAHGQEMDGLSNPGRRQTAAFPTMGNVNSPGASSADTMQDSMDDLALLFPGCLPTPRGTGHATNTEYFSNWLGQVTTPSSLAETQVAQPRQTSSAPPLIQDHRWPDPTFDFVPSEFTTDDSMQPLTTAATEPSLTTESKQMAESNARYLFSKANQRPWPY